MGKIIINLLLLFIKKEGILTPSLIIFLILLHAFIVNKIVKASIVNIFMSRNNLYTYQMNKFNNIS